MKGAKIGVTVALVAVAAAAGLLFMNVVENTWLIQSRDGCLQHLNALHVKLGTYRSSQAASNYPFRLRDMPWGSADASNLVCPSSHSQVGSLSNAEEWTDYIYVVDSGGKHTTDFGGQHAMDMPQLLCPPANHFGRSGLILYSEGAVRSMWLDEFDRFVESIYVDTNLAIHVSAALTRRSKGRYKSRP